MICHRLGFNSSAYVKTLCWPRRELKKNKKKRKKEGKDCNPFRQTLKLDCSPRYPYCRLVSFLHVLPVCCKARHLPSLSQLVSLWKGKFDYAHGKSSLGEETRHKHLKKKKNQFSTLSNRQQKNGIVA